MTEPTKEQRDGRIIIALIPGPLSTADIVDTVSQRSALTKQDLLSLYMRGLIHPIGFHEGYSPHRTFFEQDFIWELTAHGRGHRNQAPHCHFCQHREHLRLVLSP